jgi:hypothetical protein
MYIEALHVLSQIIEFANIKDHILIGHSDGGSIGIIYAITPVSSNLKGLVTEAAHMFCEQVTMDSIYAAKLNYDHENLKKGLKNITR